MAKGFNLTAEINLRGPSNIRQVVGNIRKQLTGLTANVNVKLNPQTAKQITAVNKSFQTFNKTLQQTSSVSRSTAAALKQLSSSASGLSGNLKSIPQNLQKTVQATQQITQSNAKAAKATTELTTEFAEFGRQSALAVRRFAAFATVTGVIYRVSNAISSASKDFVDFQKELVKVAQVTNTSLGGLDFLVDRISQLSTGLGVSSQELIGVSRTLSQAGLSATETSKALQALARSALAPTFDNLNNTVEGSIALMKQFSISANQLEGALGSINAVAGKFAVEAGDIITAISRTGGVFANASKGVSQGTDALNEFIAVFTSVRATTRESAETIATGLRTIFTRIQREDTIDALKAYGVALTDLQGKFVGPYEATRRLAEGLSQLDPRDIRFSRIVEELGGFRQIGKVIPLIQQFSTAQAALNVAQRGSGSLARDAATAQLSLANQIAKVQEQFSALVRDIGQSQGFRDLARLALDLTSGMVALADAAKSALPALTAIFAIKGFSALTQFGGGFLKGIKRGSDTGLNDGGYVRHFARGGSVPGVGNRDTVPAMLQPGEFVIRKKAVETIGTQNLHEMNKYGYGGSVKRYGKGGTIVGRSNKIEKSHIGGNIELDDAQIFNLVQQSKNKKIAFAIENHLGKDKKDITQADIPQLRKKLGLSVKKRYLIDLPASFNQALRITDPNYVAKQDLVNYVKQSKTNIRGVDNQSIANKISTLPAKNASYPDGKGMAPAFDTDSELDSVATFIEQKFKTDYLDFMFKGATKEFYSQKGLNPKRARAQDRVSGRLSRLSSGGKIQRFLDGGGVQQGKQFGGVGIFDSDMIGAGSKDVLNALLASGKPYDVISGPAGAGKTTFAKARFGNNFILSADDLDQYAQAVVLSGAGATKAGGFSPQAQALMARARKVIALQPTADRVLQQRQGRLDQAAKGSLPDKRSLKQLEGTFKAPTTIDRELYKGLSNVEFVQNFATGGLVEEDGVGAIVLTPRRGGKGKYGYMPSKATVGINKGLIENKLGQGLSIDPDAPGAQSSSFWSQIADGNKSYNVEMATTSKSTARSFRAIVKGQLLKSAKESASRLSQRIGLAAPEDLPLSASKDFVDSMNDASVGNLFENTLASLKGPPFSTDSKASFDFPNNQIRNNANLTSLFPGLTSSFVDAKSTGDEVTVEAMRTKILGKLAAEARSDRVAVSSQGTEGPARSLTSPTIAEKYTNEEIMAMGFKPGSFGESGFKKTQRKNKQNQSLYEYLGDPQSRNLGGAIKRFAVGGSAEDTVPALLTPGEFVINKKAASRIGSQRLHKLNKADKIQGYNKGGSVGFIQKFANGGDVFDFADNIATVSATAEKAMDDFLAALVDKIVQAKPDISFDDAYREAQATAGGTVAFGTMQAAQTGDQNAAKAVYDAQRKQVVAITKQIRANNKSVTIAEARAAAERQVAQNWGGLVKKVKQGQQVQQQVNQAGQKLVQAQNQNAQAQKQGAAAGGGGKFNFSGLGTALAFLGPTLADQLGGVIGGTTGAGISGAAGAISAGVGVGAQFGPIGAFVGAVGGLVASVDAYSSAVAAKEAEIAQTKIEDTLQRSEKAFERFGKNVNDVGAFRDVANALSQVRAQEEELARAQKEANAPGLITRGLRAVGLSSAPTAQELGGRAASAQRGGAEIAQRTIDLGFAAGLDLSQIQAKLNQSGQSLDELVVDILKADTAYQEQVAKIQAKNLSSDNENAQINALTNEKKKEIQQSLASRNAQVLQARANAKLTKAITVASASITRTFDNLDQSIAAASNSLKNVQGAINKIVTGATGFNRSLESINVLQNPKAFSRAEQNAAIKQGSQFAGADRAFVERMSRFSLDVNDIIGSIAATGQKSGEDPAQTAKKTVDAVTKAVENQFGRSALTDQIRKDLSRAIKDAAEKGEDIDIQKLLENKIPEFNIGKRALESAAKSAQILEQAFTIASGAVNEYAKIQNQLRDNQANYQNTLLQSDLALKEALGQRVTVGERIGARNRVAATRAGVRPNQLTGRDLGARRDTLQRTVNRLENELEQTRNAFDKNVPGATAKLIDLEKRFASAENALRSTEAAISDLPKTIEANINDIIGEIGRVQQERAAQQQAGASFAERLVGSTPQELAELSGTFNVLNNTLNGQITTINQSQAAQQAYFQALRNGSSQQEAYAAAQQAFAGQTKSALSLFNEFAQFSGLEGPEINNIRADLLEGFAKAQGFGVQNNPIFKTIIENLRKPPEQSPEIIALTKALDEQQRKLAEAQTQVNQGLLSKQEQILRGVNETLITQLKQIEFKFDQAQVNQMSLGIARPGRTTGARPLQDGGVVYASQGQYVNYQPRGTDTVPAMLTPGEFVVNAKAAKNNLGLLRSINSSTGGGKAYSRGGVVYARNGFDPRDLDFTVTDDGMELYYNGQYMGNVSSNALDPALGRPDAMDSASDVAARQRRRSGAHVAGGAGLQNTGGSGSGRKPGRFRRGVNAVAGSRPGQAVSNYVRGNIGGIGTQLGTQIVANAAANYAGIDIDPTVAQAGGVGLDVARALTSAPANAGTAYRVGRGATALGVNAGFDVLQTGYELVSDPREFDRRKREQSEESIGVVGGAVSGLSRPVDTIIRGGYTYASYRQARADSISAEEKTKRMRMQGVDTDEYWMTGLGPRARTYVSEMIRIKLERERLAADQSMNPADRQRLNDILDRQEAGLPKPTKDDVKYADPRSGYSTGYSIDTFVQQSLDRAIEEGATETTRRRTQQADKDRRNTELNREFDKIEARSLGLKDNATQKEIQEARVNKATTASEAKGIREEKAISLGLRPNASQDQIDKAQDRQDKIVSQREKEKAAQENRAEKYPTYERNYKLVDAFRKDRYPPDLFTDEYNERKSKRDRIFDEINSVGNSQLSSYTPFGQRQISAEEREKFEREKNQKLDALYADLDQENKFLLDYHKEKLPYGEELEQARERYRKGQDQIVKDKEKQQRRQNARLAQQKANAIYSAAKYANIRVPDKFANPGAFLSWRKNIQKRLQADFPFAGQMQEALKQLGVPGDVLTGIYEPFKPDELEAVYSGMLAQGGLGAEATAYVAALRQSKANAAKKIQNDPRLQQIIASASPQVKSQIARKFGSTFGKQARQVGIFNRVVGGFQNLDPRRQGFARANLLTRLSKQGLIDINASDEDNIRRLTALQGGAVASFMYPGVGGQTQNRALRPKRLSGGGVVYASTGMMVPYEPRGTDTVPAMLTPGEFVVNRAATQKHRPLLESINKSKGGSVKYLQEGGSTDINKYIQGVPIESPLAQEGSGKQDEILSNIKTNTDISKQANSRTQNIDRNTNQVPQRFKDNKDILKDINTNADQAFANVFDQLNFITASIASDRFKPQNINQAVQLGNIRGALDAFSGQILGFASGGKVPLYAQKGTMVNYQPQGTDTVPAMLTPGEFVVNAKSSKENLGLLQAINSGYMNDGGIVYAQNGGRLGRAEEARIRREWQEGAPSKKSQVEGNLAMAWEFFKQTESGGLFEQNQQIKLRVQALMGNLTNDPSDFMAIAESVRMAGQKYPNAVALIKQLRTMQQNLAKFKMREFSIFPNTIGDAGRPVDGDIAFGIPGLGGYTLNEMKDKRERETDGFIGGFDFSQFDQFAFLEDQINILKDSWMSDLPQLQQRFGGIQGLSRGGVVYAQNGKRIPSAYDEKLAKGMKAYNLEIMKQSLDPDVMDAGFDGSRRFGYNAYEKFIDSTHEGLQELIGGNKPPPGQGLFAPPSRLDRGTIAGKIQDYYDFNIDPQQLFFGKGHSAQRQALEWYLEELKAKDLMKRGIVPPGLEMFSRGGPVYAFNGGEIDVTDQRALHGQADQLTKSLLPYTSSEEGRNRLLQARGANFSVRSVSVGNADLQGAIASSMPSGPGGIGQSDIKFTKANMQSATVRHEMAHSLANVSHSVAGVSARLQSSEYDITHDEALAAWDDIAQQKMKLYQQQNIDQEFLDKTLAKQREAYSKYLQQNKYGAVNLQKGQVYQELINSDYQSLADTGYTPAQMEQMPNEKFAVVASMADSLSGMSATQKYLKRAMRSLGFNKGGVVYANNGMLVPYQPKGTDTVPAMLTPGEFVVNKKATQKNLPLLQSINRSKGGVAYLANGGTSDKDEERERKRQENLRRIDDQKSAAFTREQNRQASIRAQKEQQANQYKMQQQQKADRYNAMMQQRRDAFQGISSPQQSSMQMQVNSGPQGTPAVSINGGSGGFDQLTQSASNLNGIFNNFGGVTQKLMGVFNQFGTAIQQANQALGQIAGTTVNTGQGNGGGGVNTNGIQQFTNALTTVLGQLQNINIPPQISITAQHAVDVRILGGDVFAQLEPGIRDMIINETSSQLRQFGLDNFDNIG